MYKPCHNNAQCENDYSSDGFKCHCILGFAGSTCLDTVNFNNAYAARMESNSYVSFDSSYLTQSNQSAYTQIKFKFKTVEKNGIIFYFGRSFYNLSLEEKDYLSVGLKDGYLRMGFNLGSGLGLVVSDSFVTDDAVHDVVVTLDKRKGAIHVDGSISNGYSPGDLLSLNTLGDIYFGGVPDYHQINNYTIGFSGCIWNIELGISGQLNIVSASKNSRNIVPCQSEM